MDSRALSARARKLNRARAAAVPFLLLFTDPARTPDPVAAARRLPPGAGIVYRHFGAGDRLVTARRLAALAARRRLVLLIGADARLAQQAGADGVHLPQRMLGQAQALRRAFPHWTITAAAHAPAALRRAEKASLAASVLSPVFASASPSAGTPLGLRRAAAMARAAGLPVLAMGGISLRTARRLAGVSFAGLAGIESFAAK